MAGKRSQNFSRLSITKKLKRFLQSHTGFFKSCICKWRFFQEQKMICYDPTHLPEGKGEQVMVAGCLWRAITEQGHTPRSKARLSLCQHFPDLLVCHFPQPKTSQANRCLSKYTPTLEYNVLVLINYCRIAGKILKTHQNQATPFSQQVKQSTGPRFFCEIHSLDSYTSTVSQGHTYLWGDPSNQPKQPSKIWPNKVAASPASSRGTSTPHTLAQRNPGAF